MIESTDYLIHKHFNKLLADPDVEILDPATGTGTFITELIEYLPNNKLKYKYQNEIHCNEVAILPYYIANLNIEYTYQQKMGEYEEFNNICFVDTLDHTSFHGKQGDLFAMSLENTERIKRQNDRTISVIIGNPPYNAKQENFNDHNANRSYKNIDDRIKATYIKHGKAQNQIVLYDMYVRFIRWASDRLNNNGIIALITNNSFIDGLTFDGFRKVLGEEFSHIYIIDLGGNVRQNPKISGTTHNVFGIQAGVSISLLVKTENHNNGLPCQVFYTRRPEFETAKEKLDFIAKNKLHDINFTHIIPDKKHNWINQSDNNFDDLLPLIDKDVKSGKSAQAIFKLFSRGVITQRDEWVYDFAQDNLTEKMKFLISIYQQTLENKDFADQDQIKWDAELTSYLKRKIEKEFNDEQILLSLYRPFTKQYLYLDKHFNGRTYQWFNIYNRDDSDNKYMAFSGLAHNKPFSVLSLNSICDLGFIETCQCVSLYSYDEKGDRIENITDWGLKQFRNHYQPSPPQPPSPSLRLSSTSLTTSRSGYGEGGERPSTDALHSPLPMGEGSG
ncbi:MAG TPA: type ISP restriction/modification enzyme, partial [Allocoleopsis sp.]